MNHRARTLRRLSASLGAAAVLLLALLALAGAPVSAASPAAPFPSPAAGQHVVDTANAFSKGARDNAESLIADITQVTGAQVFVYTQITSHPTYRQTSHDAVALFEQWNVGGATSNGLVLMFDFDATRTHGEAALAVGVGYGQYVPDDEIQAVESDTNLSMVGYGALDDALTAALSRIDIDAQVIASGGSVGNAAASAAPGASGQPSGPGSSVGPSAAPTPSPAPTASPSPSPSPAPSIAVGPPYPPPTTGQRIYDYAGVFAPETLVKAQAISIAIEKATGAQVVVYTQVKPDVDTNQAESDAQALLDQWHVGRAGFDDGLVILFDLDESKIHGQVQLYAGDGFANAYLTDEERQGIYQNDMLPLLESADLDGALLKALDDIQAATTPAHAASLEQARQINSVLGLVVAPLILLLLLAWVGFSWLRWGRDPHYLDDPSVYANGPPADLTPASGAFILDQGPSRRALTTAMLDLASHGEITFKEDSQGVYGSVGLQVGESADSGGSGGKAGSVARVNSTRALGPAEKVALDQLKTIASGKPDGYIDPMSLGQFGLTVSTFDLALETQVVQHGWFRTAPRVARNRWLKRGALELVAGFVVFTIGAFWPISGLVLCGLALAVAGIATMVIAPSMPAVTMAGAMVRAMLAAYKRTLEATMTQARSMNEVVEKAAMPWLTTPDEAMVWGTAVGLQPAIEGVLQRSLHDVAAGTASGSTYMPQWYVPASMFAPAVGAGLIGGTGGVAHAGGSAFSGSAIPNFSGMFSVLGTIGNGPVSISSGSSGGGGGFSSGGDFGGGGSGGGGGGAGGGF